MVLINQVIENSHLDKSGIKFVLKRAEKGKIESFFA